MQKFQIIIISGTSTSLHGEIVGTVFKPGIREQSEIFNLENFAHLYEKIQKEYCAQGWQLVSVVEREYEGKELMRFYLQRIMPIMRGET